MAKKKIKKKKSKKAAKPVFFPHVVPYPNAAKKVLEFEKKLDDQIAAGVGEVESPKRGRGRPLKEPEAAPVEFNVPEKIVNQAIRLPFDLWAISADVKELKLLDDEANLLTAPVKQLLDYYAPKIPIIAIAWASLVLSSYSILAGRLKLIQELKKQKAAGTSPSSGVRPAGPPVPPASTLKSDKFPGEEDIKPEHVNE